MDTERTGGKPHPTRMVDTERTGRKPHPTRLVADAMQSPSVWISESRQFFREVMVEARKITWPTQKEAVAGTIGVVVVVALITLALSVVDAVLGQALRVILPS